MFRRLQITFPEGAIFISCTDQKLSTLQEMHACKIFFNYSKLCVTNFFEKRKCNFCHQNTFLDAFRTNSRNIIGRNPSMVIPLLANQDLTPMLRDTQNLDNSDFLEKYD